MGEALGGSADGHSRRLRLMAAQWFRPRGDLSPQQIADGYVDLVLCPGRSR